jgi:hypothetical protein
MKRLMLPLIIIVVLVFCNTAWSNNELNINNKNIKGSELMVRNLSRNFNVKANLRGLAKRGYCRPTIKNFFIGPKEKYLPTWCGGGTAPPGWFPDEDWKGYPIWPGEEVNKPNYNGPYAPDISNGVPFPSEDTPYTTVSGNWEDTLKDTSWTIADDNSTWNGPNEIIYDGTDEGPGNPGSTITPDETTGDLTDIDIIKVEFDGPTNQYIEITDGDDVTIYENIKYPSGQMINVSETTTLGSINMYNPVATTIKSVNYYDVAIPTNGGDGGGETVFPGNEVFFLRSNDADGSTNFVDSSPSNHTIDAYGGVKHSTTRSYSDASSVYFSDAAYPIDRLEVPASEDFNFGTGDFEISFYIWKTDYSAYGDQFIFEIFHGGWMMYAKQNNLYLKDG